MHTDTLFGLLALSGFSLASLARRSDNSTHTSTMTASGPTADDTASNCISWYTVVSGDSCNKVTNAFDIGMGDFLSWNPSISDDCKSGFKAGYDYCVGVKTADTPSNGTTTSAISPSVTSAPSNTSISLGGIFATTSTTTSAPSTTSTSAFTFTPPTKVAIVDRGTPSATEGYYGMPFQTLDARFPIRKNLSMPSVLLCESSDFNTSASYCAIADAYSQPAFSAYAYGGNHCRLSPFLEMLNGFVNVSSIAVMKEAKTCRFYNTIDCQDDGQWIQASAEEPVADIPNLLMDDEEQRNLISGGWPVLSFTCGNEYEMK